MLWPLLKRPMAAYFDDLAPGWDERTGAPGASHLAPLAVAVTKIDRRPERALDLGTGTGVAALFLAREFPHAAIRGVDISEAMIRQAQGKVGLDPDGRVVFKVADASDLPFPDEHFDLVTQLNMPPFFARDGPGAAPRRPRDRRRKLRRADAVLHPRRGSRARLRPARLRRPSPRGGSAAAPTSSPARASRRASPSRAARRRGPARPDARDA